jgi:hypothetical protein
MVIASASRIQGRWFESRDSCYASGSVERIDRIKLIETVRKLENDLSNS